MNKSMSFAADICKNAVVTDCLVLKDKKAFPSQWNARESIFEPRKDSGFQVRDLYLSLCFSCSNTNAIFTPGWLLDYLMVKALMSETKEETERQCVLKVRVGRVTDRNLFPLFPPGPTLLFQDSCLQACEVVLTITGDSMGFHTVRPELIMSRFGCCH